jgi:tetratricopeptide (TPR) repeat protein
VDGRWAALAGAGQSVTIVDLVSGREILALPPEGGDVWSLAWAPEGTKLAVGLSDGAVAVWDLDQVRARLADFGFDSPSTGRAKGAPIPSPVPAFDRVVRVNRLRSEAERARRLATAAREAGDHAAERDHIMAALSLDARLAEAVPDAAGHRKRLAWTHGALAQLSDLGAAQPHLEAEAGLLRRLTLADPGNPVYRRLRAGSLTGRSRVLDRAGRWAEAVTAARQAVAAREELAVDPGTAIDRDQLWVAYHNLGHQLSRAGQPAEAERWYKAALAAGDQLARDLPATADDHKFRANRASALHNLGILRAQAGHIPDAARLLREGATIRACLADAFPGNAAYASDAGRTLEWLGGRASRPGSGRPGHPAAPGGRPAAESGLPHAAEGPRDSRSLLQPSGPSGDHSAAHGPARRRGRRCP